MIPADALKIIRSVRIHYNSAYIVGFSFFDKDGLHLWRIGQTFSFGSETVEIAEDEVIVGVVAKLLKSKQS